MSADDKCYDCGKQMKPEEIKGGFCQDCLNRQEHEDELRDAESEMSESDRLHLRRGPR